MLDTDINNIVLTILFSNKPTQNSIHKVFLIFLIWYILSISYYMLRLLFKHFIVGSVTLSFEIPFRHKDDKEPSKSHHRHHHHHRKHQSLSRRRHLGSDVEITNALVRVPTELDEAQMLSGVHLDDIASKCDLLMLWAIHKHSLFP